MKLVVVAGAVAVAAVLVLAGMSAAYSPKYGVTVKADKHTNFSHLRTYAWMSGHASDIQHVDRQIIAAVDRELAALGMRQSDAGSCDVVVTYLSMTRTDVRVKPKAFGKTYWSQYDVGVLMVSLLDPKTLTPLLELRADKRLGSATIESTIDATVAEMFTKYPKRKS